jgi:putative hydrolase of the HAD superfamily
VINVVLFDLGNTLVRYFTKAEFPTVLDEAISGLADHLRREGGLQMDPTALRQRVAAENHEAADNRVRPLAQRLARIFELKSEAEPDSLAARCEIFLQPFFARARRYEDSLPTLEALRVRGYRTALVSNLPWGSPPAPWHREVARLGLSPWLDTVVFCSDIGWRKPARQIFEFTLDRLGAAASDCLFVGDNPRWDVAGPRALGIEAVRIDRFGKASAGEGTIPDLAGLWARLEG